MYYNYFILQVYTNKWQCGLSLLDYIAAAAARVHESSIVYILTCTSIFMMTLMCFRTFKIRP